MKLIVHGILPGLNEYVDACRRNPYEGNAMKRAAMEKVLWCIRQQVKSKAKPPVRLKYLWVEKDRRRDHDNVVGFGMKVIQDALVKGGVLHDDGWAYITGFEHEFAVDKSNPRVEITIMEAEI